MQDNIFVCESVILDSDKSDKYCRFPKIAPRVRKLFLNMSFTLGEEPPLTLGEELQTARYRLYRSQFLQQKYALENSRRDLDDALRCTALKPKKNAPIPKRRVRWRRTSSPHEPRVFGTEQVPPKVCPISGVGRGGATPFAAPRASLRQIPIFIFILFPIKFTQHRFPSFVSQFEICETI